MSDYGKPPFSELKYCRRCCMPDTTEKMTFDDMGICQICQSSEQKIHINWAEREKELKRILEDAKKNSGNNYDCIVGISGGKDSYFQLHVLTRVYGMNPLAVTFFHNWYNETGEQNLINALETFNVDHLRFTPKRNTINKLAKKSLYSIGDACWHCHAGIGNFVLQTAIRYNIPLIVWGESTAEESGKATYYEPQKFDRLYFLKTSAKKTAEEMADNDISIKELNPYVIPSQKECDRVGIKGIYLGDYMFWDDERQTEFIRDTYGWQEKDVEGTYKRYKSNGCVMTGVHDYMKFIKRGFGRATDHVSRDVRTGLLTREEGFELVKKYETKRPEALDYYLKITGLTEEEFMKGLKNLREGSAKKLP